MINQPIGLLGGTFDPIHVGHLRLAIEAYEQLNLAKVHLIPCYQPVHRDAAIASAEMRLTFVKQATENEPALYADSREIDQKQPMYTVDTLTSLRHDLPNTPLCLLIGLDAFLQFQTWHQYENILTLAHIIIAHRPGSNLPKQGSLYDFLHQHLQQEVSHLHQHLAGDIYLLPITALDISASMIRKQFALGSNPRYLLPDKVIHTIQQHGVYKP